MYRTLNNKLEGDIMKKSLRNALISSIASVGFVMGLCMAVPSSAQAYFVRDIGKFRVYYNVNQVNDYKFDRDESITTNKFGFPKGKVSGSKLYMNAGSVYFVSGGSSVKDSCSLNELIIIGGTVRGSAAGGLSMLTGTVEKNSIIISGGIVGEEGSSSSVEGAYAGLSFDGGKVNNNIASMNGGKTYMIAGGATTKKGSATGNQVNISNSAEVETGVIGASTIDGTCKNNIVNMNGGEAGYVAGAYVTGKGPASGNIVNINYDKYVYISDYVAGACTLNGSASKNEVRFKDGIVDDVYGARIYGQGSASSNKIIYYDGLADNLFGAKAVGKGSATSNSVEVNGGSIYYDVYGAHTSQGSAKSNKVTINGGYIYEDVSAAKTYASEKVGAASSNTLYVNGGTIAGDGHGAMSNGGKLSSNKVYMNGGLVKGDLYGAWGYGASTASSNNITMNSGTVNGDLHGALVTGTVSSNSIVMNGGLASSAYGAYSMGDGNATSNKVTVNLNSKITELLVGGYSISGYSSKNSVIINNNAEVGDACGGTSSSGSVTSNKVSISGTAKAISLTGGISKTGNITSNSVTIKDSVKVTGVVLGGIANNGSVSKNTVSAKGQAVSIEDFIVGGYVDNGLVSSNSVTVSDGKFDTIWGGRAAVSGDVTGNKVSISKAQQVDGLVFGGSTKKGNASKNSISISNSKVSLGVITGDTDDGNAVSNKLSITGSVVEVMCMVDVQLRAMLLAIA